ncbi:MAG: uroporphyrinogen-III synthase [Sulfurovum sp.]|nr:uroporphyrinogen-III synthase [Sulfurovum sp.]
MTKRPIYLLSPTPKEGIISLPMISFKTVAEYLDFNDADTLIFTSKQAVKTVDMIDKRWKDYPCIAIGSATKVQIEVLGGEVIYCPENFYGKMLSQDIATFFKGRKMLYFRPKKVSFDTKTYLQKKGISLKEQIVYETSCCTYGLKEMPEKKAIIIFTSPSTIHCFFRNFNWDESFTAVVIGESTRVHLPKEVKYVVADRPLIMSCIEKAQLL